VYFTGTSLTLTSVPAPAGPFFHSGYPFIGPVFTVLSGNTFGSVTNVTESFPCTPCNPVTAYASGNSLFINWTGSGAGRVGDAITVEFTVGGPVSAVPEPSTWALMLIGFAGLGFAFRRSRRNTGKTYDRATPRSVLARRAGTRSS
jgi:PEP-CTERM motif